MRNNFLKGIFTTNFRVSDTEKRSAKIFGKEIRPKVFGKWTKMP